MQAYWALIMAQRRVACALSAGIAKRQAPAVTTKIRSHGARTNRAGGGAALPGRALFFNIYLIKKAVVTKMRLAHFAPAAKGLVDSK